LPSLCFASLSCSLNVETIDSKPVRQ
jgi:hypothetical protein